MESDVTYFLMTCSLQPPPHTYTHHTHTYTHHTHTHTHTHTHHTHTPHTPHTLMQNQNLTSFLSWKFISIVMMIIMKRKFWICETIFLLDVIYTNYLLFYQSHNHHAFSATNHQTSMNKKIQYQKHVCPHTSNSVFYKKRGLKVARRLSPTTHHHRKIYTAINGCANVKLV